MLLLLIPLSGNLSDANDSVDIIPNDRNRNNGITSFTLLTQTKKSLIHDVI